jgi:hypothetical protein
MAADWTATGGATTTLTPSSPVPVVDAHETDGVNDQAAAGSFFSSRGGHWADTGAAGTVAYGVTVPTSAKYNQVAIEFLGSASPAGPPINSPGQPAGGRVVYVRVGEARSTARPTVTAPPPPAVGPRVYPLEGPVRSRIPQTFSKGSPQSNLGSDVPSG